MNPPQPPPPTICDQEGCLIAPTGTSVDTMYASADFTHGAFDCGLLWQRGTTRLKRRGIFSLYFSRSLDPSSLARLRCPPASCRTPESRRAHAVAKVGSRFLVGRERWSQWLQAFGRTWYVPKMPNCVQADDSKVDFFYDAVRGFVQIRTIICIGN